MSLLSKLGSGFDLLTADLQGWSKPERIYWVTSGKGHVPDATAWHGYTKYIFEVETADTIAIDHTRQQCELFAAYVRQHGGKFALFVPAGEETRARLQLAHWSISAEVW